VITGQRRAIVRRRGMDEDEATEDSVNTLARTFA
jgi:hypothetical protein